MRFPLYGVILVGLIWTTVAAVPALRHQISRGTYQTNTFMDRPASLDVDAALKEAPNDPFLQAKKIEQGWTPAGTYYTNRPSSAQQAPTASERQILDKNKQFFASYDALIAKNPKRIDLVKARLRLSARGGIVDEPRTEKYMRRDSGAGYEPALFPTAQRYKGQLQEVYEQARRGEKLDPQNAFFPYMEAMALCTLRREDEAVQALQRAGKCTTFNEGTFDDIRRRIAIQEKQGPVDWNEKLFIEWAELWPHLGALRAVTRE
ncbi:hypothetical protein EON80_23225, partial [bacterium]